MSPAFEKLLDLPRPLRFIVFLGQLAALFAVFVLYDVEAPLFRVLAILCITGFAVHYWLPARWQAPFVVGFSVAGAFVLLDARTAVALLAVGLAIYAVLRLPLAWGLRIALVIAVGGLLMVGRTTGAEPLVPRGFWPVLGAIFMFRTIVYAYDVRHARTPPKLLDFLGYFYLLPNYYFLLFPVVDYQTFLAARGRRPLDRTVQSGIRWIARGTLQLLLYRLVESARPDPATASSVGLVVSYMVLTYLLYLRVSGQFHIAIGMLHLFGLDLPETHRRYLLASSIADFWRRINIYWKDFILKIVYLPVFFRLRRSGEVRAAVIATIVAFVATWALHSYQWYWLLGAPLLTLPDTLFWAILGGLMVFSAVREMDPKRKPAAEAFSTARAVGTLLTFATITVLWSLWNAPSVEAWVRFVSLRGGS